MKMTSYLQGRQLTIGLSGEIDHHVAKTLITGVADKIDTFLPRHCVLDFSDVAFMDSSGIAVVINAKRHMELLDGSLSLCNVGGQPKKVLDAAGIGRIVEMV